MKRAVVLGLFVVLGAACVASAEFQAKWDTWLKLDLSPAFALGDFYSFLDLRYATSNLTVEAAGLANAEGLDAVWFEVYGSVSAFSAWSLLFFDPNSDFGSQFMLFQNAAEVSIGSVDFYGVLAIQDIYGGLGFIGTGFAVGGIGTVDDCRFAVEVTFNLEPLLWPVLRYGLYAGVTDWTYTLCSSDIWYPYWIIGGDEVYVDLDTCDLAFSYATGIAQLPICCADVYIGATFDCNGFWFLSVLVENVDFGIDWLKIYGLSITYFIDWKSIDLWTEIASGDVVCFRPYFTVRYGEDAETETDLITVNALTLSCWALGCEFYWGHIFDREMVHYDGGMYFPGYYFGGPHFDDFGFEPIGVGLVSLDEEYPCAWSVWDGETDYYPNEVVGIRCDEDSCCGGLFSFAVSNFLSTESEDPITGLLGWMGSYIELVVAVGPHVQLVGALNVTQLNGVESITMGVEVTW
ncbi:MAG: hypothetical protein NTY63_00845 [Candidatus Bipolaricaulota bacterium]|nr:hypothetical protein [Candidatus Bipolaricaulota bacterium]